MRQSYSTKRMLRYLKPLRLVVLFSLVLPANGWAASPSADGPSCRSKVRLFSDRIARLGKVTVLAAENQPVDDSSVLPRNNDGLVLTNPHFSGANETATPSLTPPATMLQANSWMERIRQLIEFKQANGHTLVPKRYKKNPSLGNWVNKQRQHYRNYLAGTKPCSLDENRIEMLNQLDFCWNASFIGGKKHQRTANQEFSSESNFSQSGRAISSSASADTQWWDRFRELQTLLDQQKETSPSCARKTHAVPRNSALGKWLQRQRQHVSLPPEQAQALQELDPDWSLTSREFQWECRYRELREYARQHGDCCVPISHPNRQLAHWVSTQRKQYNLRQQGRPSDLTLERMQRLNSIDFAWNRWEYEFAKKQKEWAFYSHES